MSDERFILPQFQAPSEAQQAIPQIELPEGVARVDFFVFERTMKKDGSMDMQLRIDSSDPEYPNTLSAFEVVGVLETAKFNVMQHRFAKR
jgi:hypothetical protein